VQRTCPATNRSSMRKFSRSSSVPMVAAVEGSMANRISKSVLITKVLVTAGLLCQAATIALLAAGQVIAHRLARAVGVAGRNGIENTAVLFMQADLIFMGQHTFSTPGRSHVAGNGPAAQRIEHFEVERIVGRSGN